MPLVPAIAPPIVAKGDAAAVAALEFAAPLASLPLAVGLPGLASVAPEVPPVHVCVASGEPVIVVTLIGLAFVPPTIIAVAPLVACVIVSRFTKVPVTVPVMFDVEST